jgi:cytochrome c556
MRIAPIAAATVALALAACKGSESTQANKAQPEAPPPATTALALITTSVSGADAKRIMHERHEGMEAIGKANKALRRELEGSSPDLGVVRSSAGKIAELSRKASGWFPQGTGPDIGRTGAKPAIWQNPEDFATKLGAFQKAAKAFNSIAAGNDVNAIHANLAELGKACKACHDKYRSEMHH